MANTFGDEIAQLMSNELMAEKVESAVQSDNISIAIDSLSKAADILENIGDHKIAEITTLLLEKIASE